MSAPTQTELQEWLRNVQGLCVEVNYRVFVTGNGFYYTMIFLPTEDRPAARIGMEYYGKDLFYGFTTYEDALEIGLQTALSMLDLKKFFKKI